MIFKAALKLVIVFAVLVALAVNLATVSGFIVSQMGPILARPGLSLKEKHWLLQGDYAVYMEFIERNTPERARILFPPREREYRPFDWLWRNNYFLCPREIIYRGDAPLTAFPSIDYVLIYKDFPDFKVRGKKIMLDDTLGLYQIEREPPDNPARNR
ncbi:MAG: hypothetical protein V1789_05880 [PVC group bacterium]